LALLGDSHHVISMRLSGPKDFIRHSNRKSRAPFKLSLRAPFRALQIDASGWWLKPPSSGWLFGKRQLSILDKATGAIKCFLRPRP